MRDLLIAMTVFGSVPVILLRPYIGILVWSWFSYMNPHRLAWGFAQTLPVAMIVGATTILAWLISKESKRIPMTPVTVLMFAFIAWTGITTIFALVPDAAPEKLVLVLKIFAITIITLPLINSRERINALVWVITLSIGFFGLKGGLFTLATGGNYHVKGPPNSFIAGNNELGMVMVMVLPLMRYLQLQARARWLRLGFTGAMLLTIAAILSTYSRGALLAGAAMLFVLWIKSLNRTMVAAMIVAVVLVGLPFMPQKWFDRMQTIETYKQDASAQGRLKMWKFAFCLARRYPITSGGFNSQEAYYLYPACRVDLPKVKAYHSNYFEVLGEHGFIGLFLYLAIGLAALLTASGIIRRTRDRPELAWSRDLAAMLQVSLIGYAVGGMFLNKAYFDLYWHLVAIIVVTGGVVAKALAETPATGGTQAVTASPAPGRPGYHRPQPSG